MCEEWVCAGSGGVVPDLVGEFTGFWLLFCPSEVIGTRGKQLGGCRPVMRLGDRGRAAQLRGLARQTSIIFTLEYWDS